VSTASVEATRSFPRRRFRLPLRVARRLLLALFVIWGVTFVTFIIARVIPGNPAYLYAGSQANAQTLKEATANLGLDKSLPEQYWIYIKGLTRLDLGTSWTSGQPVRHEIGQRLPASLELLLVSLFVAILISLLIGALAARRPNGAISKFADVLTSAGAAIPPFWLGLMLIYFFFFRLGWSPPPLGRFPEGDLPHHVTGFLLIDSLIAGDFHAWWQAADALILPVLTIALTIQPPLLRLVQVSMAQALDSPAIRTDRAMGLRPSTVVLDALRLVLLPFLSLVGLLFGALISGAVLVEVVFSWPGLGQYSVQAISSSDYSAVQGVVLVSVVGYVLVFLVLDVVQVIIDPRLRSS
jgi:dipeptide transport system permease protein